MLKPVFDYIRQLVALKRQTEENIDDIEELHGEGKQMASAIQRIDSRMDRLESRMDRFEENYKRDFENLVLRLENAMLKSERRLPPGKDSDA